MRRREVFLDTYGLAAYVNQDDDKHDIAMVCTEELIDSAARFVTTYAILTETAELLSSRLKSKGRGQILEAVNLAAEFVFDLQDEGNAEVLPVDGELWRRAWQLMNHRTDKEWGITDCISFIVMQDRNIEEAFTGDPHFAEARFRPLLR